MFPEEFKNGGVGLNTLFPLGMKHIENMAELVLFSFYAQVPVRNVVLFHKRMDPFARRMNRNVGRGGYKKHFRIRLRHKALVGQRQLPLIIIKTTGQVSEYDADRVLCHKRADRARNGSCTDRRTFELNIQLLP